MLITPVLKYPLQVSSYNYYYYMYEKIYYIPMQHEIQNEKKDTKLTKAYLHENYIFFILS